MDHKAIEQPKSDIQGEVLNWPMALKRMRGHEDQLQDLVEVFIEECPAMMKAIRDAVETHDAHESLQRAAHTLKGSADIFAAERVVEAAWRLEQIGSSGDLSEAKQAMADLDQEAEALLTAMRTHAMNAPRSS
jgi:HPt (histidine-containing phosphotransfer) domain-containing protein